MMSSTENILTKAAADKQRKPTGKIRQQNEQLIIEAAEIEFVNHGFKGASVRKIAERAGLPKANVHYYFKSKLDLYGAVLHNIIELWNSAFNDINPDDDPGAALTAYIHSKVMYSKTNPLASRIFASEIIHGAPFLSRYIETDFENWVAEKARVIKAWIEQGKMDPVDPYHLLFLIWASTQHYADFGEQVKAVLGKETLSEGDYQQAADQITQIILKGCGIKVNV